MTAARTSLGGTRRAVTLLAVLAGVAAGVLAATSVLVSASAQRGASETTAVRSEVRAALRLALEELQRDAAAQRLDLLAGGSLEFEGELVSRDTSVGRVVARIAVDSAGIPRVAPEAARLNVNTTGVEQLALLGSVSTDEAQSLAASRPVLDPFVAGLPSDAMPMVTTLSRDAVADADGSERLALEAGWAQRVWKGDVPGWSEGAIAALGAAFPDIASSSDDTGPSDLAAICAPFLASEDLARVLPEILDRVTPATAAARAGLVDVTRADEAVLACVPGFDADSARTAVERRTTLDDAALASPTWLFDEDVLDAEAFAEAIGSVAARSLQWRVVIEAGLQVAGLDGTFDADPEARLGYPAVLEAVVDVAGDEPEIVWLAHLGARVVEPLSEEMPTEVLEEQPEIDPDVMPADQTVGPRPSRITPRLPDALREQPASDDADAASGGRTGGKAASRARVLGRDA